MIIWVHEDRFSKQELVINPDVFPGVSVGDVIEIIKSSQENPPPSSQRLFMKVAFIDRELLQKQPQLQISLHSNVASVFAIQSRTDVQVKKADPSEVSADYVELSFKDQYLGRGDMFRLRNHLQNTCVFIGKKIMFSGCIRCKVKEVYSNKEPLGSALITEQTKVIFRSESAKYFIFLQISAESFEMDDFGEVYYEKAVEGFLPELFSKWDQVGTNHVVSIVLFSRVLYDAEEIKQLALEKDQNLLKHQELGFFYQDYYRVVVDWETKQSWHSVIPTIKHETQTFRRNIMLKKIILEDGTQTFVIAGQLAPASQGNILEAVNLALNIFDKHYIDRDLSRTGLSIVVISPTVGLLEASKNLIRLTTERMIEDGIGLDWVCLKPPPLFLVPVFRFKEVAIPESFSPVSKIGVSDRSNVAQSSYSSASRKQIGWKEIRKTEVVEALFSDVPSKESSDTFLYTIPHWVDVSFYYSLNPCLSQYFFVPRCGKITIKHGMDSPYQLGIPRLDIELTEKNMNEYDAKVFDYTEAPVGTTMAASEVSGSSTYSGTRKYRKPTGKLQSLLSQRIQAYNANLQLHSTQPPERTIQSSSQKMSKSLPDSEDGLSHKLRPLEPMKSTETSDTEYSSHSPSSDGRASNVVSPPQELPMGSKRSGPIFITRKELRQSTEAQESSYRETNVSAVVSSSQHTPSETGGIIRLSIDPCQPSGVVVGMSGHLRRWHHVFPQMHRKKKQLVKWNSLCTPACLPLTTDYFPTADELSESFQEYTYTVSLNEESFSDNLPLMRTDQLLMELVSQRLVQGFQAVISNTSFFSSFTSWTEWKDAPIANDGKTMMYPPASRHSGPQAPLSPLFLVMGRQVHRLVYDPTGQNVEVKRFVRKIDYSTEAIKYRCFMWPKNFNDFVNREAVFNYPSTIFYNWNYLDHVVAGYQEELTDTLKFWRTRFMLIPTENAPQMSMLRHPQNETLTEEELRLAGFTRFIELFQKAKFVSKPEEVVIDPIHPGKPASKPLPIVFTTFNISTYVKNEVQSQKQLAVEKATTNRAQSAVDGPRLTKDSKFSQIAAAMTSSVNGIQMKDRRWHLRFYEKVFVGNEFVDWLIKHFADIDTRDDAVEFGNFLMKKGLLEHVNKIHRFLDGHYFYRLSKEYTSNSTFSGGPMKWFRTASFQAAPPRPEDLEEKAVPMMDLASDFVPSKLELTRRMLIDIDPQKKSDRRELAVLHYETVHNAKNCYHFHLHWLVCTSRLVEDLLQNWTRLAEKYGLKLVEAPVDQNSDNPFQNPVEILPVIAPPVVDKSKLTVKSVNIPDDYFEVELIKKFGFILDVESDELMDFELVQYSYTRSRYKFTQYVHRSGSAFILIIPNKKGFLWLNNRLLTSHSSTQNAPHPDSLRAEFQDFCQNAGSLEKFYIEAAEKLFTSQGLVSIFENVTDELAKKDEQLIVNREGPADLNVSSRGRSESAGSAETQKSSTPGSPLLNTVSDGLGTIVERRQSISFKSSRSQLFESAISDPNPSSSTSPSQQTPPKEFQPGHSRNKTVQ